MSNFTLLCRNCWDTDSTVVDNCCVHQIDENVIMLRCHQCGTEEYISERKRFKEEKTLLKEKKIVLRLLKLHKKPTRRIH